MSDINCPYCDAGCDICHDDGFGYSEDTRHEMECDSYGKGFVFTTSISFSYDPNKADCLNGLSHKLVFRKSYPTRYSMMRCEDCDFERKPTPEEFTIANVISGD